MANVLVRESSLEAIADAIREKLNTEDTYKPSEMADAIESISGGSTPVINSLSVTENGTYTAPTGVDGYSPVTVNVPSSGSTIPEYSLSGYRTVTGLIIESNHNHFKITATANKSSASINLRNLDTALNSPLWFTIPASANVTVEYTNVVNEGGVEWNANFKQANTTTSMGYGIGNGTHLDGASTSVVQTNAADVGCLFVYVASMSSGDVLEADVAITINGTRIV